VFAFLDPPSLSLAHVYTTLLTYKTLFSATPLSFARSSHTVATPYSLKSQLNSNQCRQIDLCVILFHFFDYSVTHFQRDKTNHPNFSFCVSFHSPSLPFSDQIPDLPHHAAIDRTCTYRIERKIKMFWLLQNVLY